MHNVRRQLDPARFPANCHSSRAKRGRPTAALGAVPLPSTGMSDRRQARRGSLTIPVGVAVTAAILLSGCVSGDDATPTTSRAPAASVSPADDPQRFDWVAIITELDQRRADAQSDPSLDAVDTFCAPVSECNERWFDSIGALVENGLRMVGGQPDEVVNVTYSGTLDGSPLSEAFEVVLDVERLATEQGAVQLVTDDGSVEQEFRPDDETPPGTPVFEAIVLQRQTLDSEWLVFETG